MPTLESFDKKLGEADAYLQLLIEQTKVWIIQVWISFYDNNNILCFVLLSQNLGLKMNSLCEEDKAHCECIISETNVNIYFFAYLILLWIQIIHVDIL